MNKRNLRSTSAMTRRHWDFVSIGEDDAGGGASGGGGSDSGGGGNNQQGNSGTENNNGSTQNNNGSGFDPAAFWNEPEPSKDKGSPATGSADSGSSGDSGADFGKQLTERLNSLTFGAPVFNEAVVAELGEGKLDGVNNAIQSQLRQATQQSVVMAAQLMQKHQEVLLTKVKEMISGELGNRDNSATLEENFAIAKDPALRPMVEGVFNQALKLAGGDRKKAIASTREMLKYMGKTGARDMGIDTPPADPGDTMNDSARSLVDELLGR
jgi:hypothetical protein